MLRICYKKLFGAHRPPLAPRAGRGDTRKKDANGPTVERGAQVAQMHNKWP